ncbi:MAG TPA: M1 family aminopeptidase [Pyrinomonadaceae bacterium]|nr:M1 family aminopeptidase [Pyrinomonadaceae bacterium]
MNKRAFYRLFTAYVLIITLFSGFVVSARPLIKNPLILEEKKPLPPVNWIRSRNVDIKHVSIDLRFDWKKESAMGSTSVTLAPFGNRDWITLDAADFTISSVTSANGSPLKYEYNPKGGDDNLKIYLDRTYRDGEDLTIKISYATNFVNTADAETPIGAFGRGLRFIKPTENEPQKPRQIWSQGETEFNRYWFPSYDSPNDFRTSELRATVEKPFYVVSNGKLESITENSDGTRTFYWKMDIPYTNYLTSIVVGEYVPVEQSWDGIPILNFGYPNETKQVAATVKNLPDMVRFFSEKTGIRYPYPKYSQTMVEDFGGGMENISATTQIEEMIHDERELLDEDSDSLQAHELAHQWFGDYVTCRDWGQIWLNESFATYMDALYAEYSKGHDEFLYGNIRDFQNQYLEAWKSGNRHPIATKYYANKDAMFDTYAYPRGGAVLHMLRKHLGDDLFWKAMNHYLKSNAHRPVSTEQLRVAIEEATGQSMDWFFDQWIYKMGHPIFDVSKSFDTSSKKLKIQVKQTQKIDPNDEYPQVEFFQGWVEIEIDGKVEKVWIKPQEVNDYEFTLTAAPKLVNFDFESTWIKELKFEKSVDELIYQMLNDRDILGKRWAMGQLMEKASDANNRQAVINSLLEAMQKDKSWRIRRAALSVLAGVLFPDQNSNKQANIKLEAAVAEAVEKLTKDERSLVRADAIQLLGETRDQKYVQLYIDALGDQSYTVIEEAALALGLTKSPKAFEPLSNLTKGNSWRGRIETAGLKGLAALEDKRAFESAYRLATDKTRPLSVRANALSVVASTGKGDPRAFPLIFEGFKSALDKNDFENLVKGIQAIIKLSDPRGQQAFDLMKEKFKDQPQLLEGVKFFEQQFQAAVRN